MLMIKRLSPFRMKSWLKLMKLDNLQVWYLLDMLMLVSLLFQVIWCLWWESLIRELSRSIRKKPKRRTETLGGWLMLWISMKKRKPRVKLWKLDVLLSISILRESLFLMLQVIRTMYQTWFKVQHWLIMVLWLFLPRKVSSSQGLKWMGRLESIFN